MAGSHLFVATNDTHFGYGRATSFWGVVHNIHLCSTTVGTLFFSSTTVFTITFRTGTPLSGQFRLNFCTFNHRRCPLRPALPASRTPLFSRFLCRIFLHTISTCSNTLACRRAQPPSLDTLATLYATLHHSTHPSEQLTRRLALLLLLRNRWIRSLFSWPLTLVLQICAAPPCVLLLFFSTHFGDYLATALEEPRDSKQSGTVFCTVSRIRQRIGIGILPLAVTPRCNQPSDEKCMTFILADFSLLLLMDQNMLSHIHTRAREYVQAVPLTDLLGQPEVFGRRY